MDRVVLLDGLEHAGADLLVQVLLLQAFLHKSAIHFGRVILREAGFHHAESPLRDIDVASVSRDGSKNLGHGFLVTDKLVEGALARLFRLGGSEPFGRLGRARLYEIVLEYGTLQQAIKINISSGETERPVDFCSCVAGAAGAAEATAAEDFGAGAAKLRVTAIREKRAVLNTFIFYRFFRK